jgi:hypothetical protein
MEISVATWIWILIAIAAVVVVAAGAMTSRQHRTTALRQRFGPEYERTVEDDQVGVAANRGSLLAA